MGLKFQTKKYKTIIKELGLTKDGKLQKMFDMEVVKHLQAYVSFKEGTQSASIKIATKLGSGLIRINVPYAEIQAYSKRIKKRAGKRGTRPFERMVADKQKVILDAIANYSRKING